METSENTYIILRGNFHKERSFPFKKNMKAILSKVENT